MKYDDVSRMRYPGRFEQNCNITCQSWNWIAYFYWARMKIVYIYIYNTLLDGLRIIQYSILSYSPWKRKWFGANKIGL